MSEKNEIIFHQIRNCTTKLTYAGIHILIDPFLVPKDYYPGLDIAPTPEMKKIRVPMNELPISIDEILKDIEAVIISHTHIIIGMIMPLNTYPKICQYLSKILEIKK